MSTWSCGSKSNSRGSPQVLISTLSSSVAPTGTDSCGGFGSGTHTASNRASSSSASSSSVLYRSANSLAAAIAACFSSP